MTAYRLAGRPEVDEAGLAWTRDWQAGYAPPGEGWSLLWTVPMHLEATTGRVGVWPGLLAAGVLLATRRRLLALVPLSISALLLCLLVANSRFWVLPLSYLLYPERVVYFVTPLAALLTAIAWRALPPAMRHSVALRVGLCLLLVPLATTRHWQGFQRVAWRPAVGPEEWQALRWAGRHLDPRRTLISAGYNTAGSYLPAVAGVASNGWHMHHFNAKAQERLRARTPTHVFLIRSNEADRGERGTGEAIFDNGRVCILETGE